MQQILFPPFLRLDDLRKKFWNNTTNTDNIKNMIYQVLCSKIEKLDSLRTFSQMLLASLIQLLKKEISDKITSVC